MPYERGWSWLARAAGRDPQPTEEGGGRDTCPGDILAVLLMARSIRLRNPYVDPLNYIQVEMLRRLRALEEPEGEKAEALREVIVLTINGIAAGLRNTG